MAQASQPISGRALVDQLLAAAKRSTQAAQDAQDAAKRLAEGRTAAEPVPAVLGGIGAQGGQNP